MKPHKIAQDEIDPPKKAAEPFASPTKGILLTPGAGTSRKKNVSFLQYDVKPEDESAYEDSFVAQEVDQDDTPSKKTHRQETRPGPSAFTKTLLEMSKQRANEHLNLVGNKKVPQHKPVPKILAIQDTSEKDPDQTIDLAKPRSRSGKHWKRQYETYFSNSDREMKSIIKYGQNVKSYAVKRDSEASMLSEQLQKESARVKEMEAKILRITKKLNIAQELDTKPASYHARLISELAQQTALASKYEQEVDRYRKALQRQPATENIDSSLRESKKTSHETHDQLRNSQQASARDEIEVLQRKANDAESKADKLQEENAALKRSLARVKTEMSSYDDRRQAREERLQKRMEKHKVQKDAAEAQLDQLRKDYQQLLVKSTSTAENVLPASRHQPHETYGKKGLPFATSEHTTPRSRPATEVKITSISPRKRRQPPAVDIWSSQSPEGGEDEGLSSPNKERMDLAPSSVKHDIHRALKEIDLNLGTSEKASMALVSPKIRDDVVPHKEPIGYEDEVPIYPSSTSWRASRDINTTASSPAKLGPTRKSLHSEARELGSFRATTGRSASMISAHGGHRLGSMASVRSGTPLTSDRAAAARARLAERKADNRRARQAINR
ncbi:MAG: hypothetical protein OHK93_002945 [Ramalina farinacea]|uniref:Spindle pole body-associated protein cut12 domain-containing protein n=1 Tax=Ramalina farinacea TaxID=258253 RepID=A0AA43QWV4_9LECA|nr:hypothetical protein [Ramalina farinacea]